MEEGNPSVQCGTLDAAVERGNDALPENNVAVIIEDSTNNACLFGKMLLRQGYSPVHFKDIISAKGFIEDTYQQGKPIAKIVSDLDLKGTSGQLARFDGYHFLKWLDSCNRGRYDGMFTKDNVLLCSTMFDDDCPMLFKPLARYVRAKVEGLGFGVASKREILGAEDYV